MCAFKASSTVRPLLYFSWTWMMGYWICHFQGPHETLAQNVASRFCSAFWSKMEARCVTSAKCRLQVPLSKCSFKTQCGTSATCRFQVLVRSSAPKHNASPPQSVGSRCWLKCQYQFKFQCNPNAKRRSQVLEELQIADRDSMPPTNATPAQSVGSRFLVKYSRTFRYPRPHQHSV